MACCNRPPHWLLSKVLTVDDEQSAAETAPDNAAVAAAMGKLESLEEAPLGQHAAIFEDVRSDLRAALDAD